MKKILPVLLYIICEKSFGVTNPMPNELTQEIRESNNGESRDITSAKMESSFIPHYLYSASLHVVPTSSTNRSLFFSGELSVSGCISFLYSFLIHARSSSIKLGLVVIIT